MAKASMKDVARLAGVSIATVSRVLNGPEQVNQKTRDKVQAAIASTGYSPNKLAAAFRRGRTNVIMAVLPSVGDPFFTGVMKGVRDAASRLGYNVLINETQFNTMTKDELGAMIVSRQVDGIILLASMSPFGTEILSAHSHQALPIVVGCEAVTDELSRLPCVHIDNIAAAREATEYLIKLGHKTISFMRGDQDNLLTLDRERGFQQAMDLAGLEVQDRQLANGHMTISGALQAATQLLSAAPRPTAIFCANDEMAIGTIHAARGMGLRVPEDLSIVGFDDTRYAAVIDPPLTTISQPTYDIGVCSLERLVRKIEGTSHGRTEPELLPHRFIVRKSTAAIS